MISVVCPFYNEAAIIEGAAKHMLTQLGSLDEPWELILVDDGSRDGSRDLVEPLQHAASGLRVIGYPHNQGRGFALRTGIEAARGDIVVTTEVDCSWGDDVVHRIVRRLREDPALDMVVASPNLPGGGYRNVPRKRVLLSRIGNAVLRLGHSSRLTMYTGMTRGYRRDRFLILPLDEKEKEFHLEVARKAQAFDFRIVEVPAVLEWKEHRFARAGAAARKSSSRVPKLIGTHLAFGLAAAPFRYIIPMGAIVGALGIFFLGWAVANLFTPAPSVYLVLIALSLFLFSFLMMVVGVLAYQGVQIHHDLWRLRSELRQRGAATFEDDFSFAPEGRDGVVQAEKQELGTTSSRET